MIGIMFEAGATVTLAKEVWDRVLHSLEDSSEKLEDQEFAGIVDAIQRCLVEEGWPDIAGRIQVVIDSLPLTGSWPTQISRDQFPRFFVRQFAFKDYRCCYRVGEDLWHHDSHHNEWIGAEQIKRQYEDLVVHGTFEINRWIKIA